MPEIKLTQKELDHLRSYYEFELEETHKYIKQLKSIIRKLDSADKPTVVKPIFAAEGIVKPSGKKIVPPVKTPAEAPVKTEAPKPKGNRGRPKKVIAEQPKLITGKPERKAIGKLITVKAEGPLPGILAKAKPNGPLPGMPATAKPEIPFPVKPESVKPSPVTPPKPKRKRISNYRPQGVFLTSLSKPIPKLPEDDLGLPFGSKNTHIIK